MIIDGKKEAAALREEIKKEIISIKSKTNKVPGLSVILIGEFAPSLIYVRNKEKNSKEVGINSNVIKYSNDVKEEEVLKKIKELNNDKNVSGILVQLPLQDQIDKKKIINSIDPSKDVDGFNPINVGNLSSGYSAIVPCTPLGCLLLIAAYFDSMAIANSQVNNFNFCTFIPRESEILVSTSSKTELM